MKKKVFDCTVRELITYCENTGCKVCPLNNICTSEIADLVCILDGSDNVEIEVREE